MRTLTEALMPSATPSPEAEQPASADGVVSEDLAGKLTAIRDKFLMPTPDKDFTDYAVITRCIERLTASASMVEEREKDREALEAMRKAFGDPMTRRALGGHNEAQMEAMLAARSRLQARTGAE